MKSESEDVNPVSRDGFILEHIFYATPLGVNLLSREGNSQTGPLNRQTRIRLQRDFHSSAKDYTFEQACRELVFNLNRMSLVSSPVLPIHFQVIKRKRKWIWITLGFSLVLPLVLGLDP